MDIQTICYHYYSGNSYLQRSKGDMPTNIYYRQQILEPLCFSIKLTFSFSINSFSSSALLPSSNWPTVYFLLKCTLHISDVYNKKTNRWSSPPILYMFFDRHESITFIYWYILRDQMQYDYSFLLIVLHQDLELKNQPVLFSTLFREKAYCAVPENIHTPPPPPRMVNGNSEGDVGVNGRKFPKG